MRNFLTDPTNLYIIIGVLLLAILLLGSGKGLGTLVCSLIHRLLGKPPVIVNIGKTTPFIHDDEYEGPERRRKQICRFEPSKCTAHQGEVERSLDNKTCIQDLKRLQSTSEVEIKAFIAASAQDREEMRNFREDIYVKVNGLATVTSKMEGKLDLLLQGARVRWNSGIIPPNNE